MSFKFSVNITRENKNKSNFPNCTLMTQTSAVLITSKNVLVFTHTFSLRINATVKVISPTVFLLGTVAGTPKYRDLYPRNPRLRYSRNKRITQKGFICLKRELSRSITMFVLTCLGFLDFCKYFYELFNKIVFRVFLSEFNGMAGRNK